jgi:hypothetical protein
LFCPGIGIAVDAWAALIAPFEHPTVGSGFSTLGVEGVLGVFSLAPSNSMQAHSAVTAKVVSTKRRAEDESESVHPACAESE